MPLPVQRLFVHGFPGLYGGAGTELHHQILAWRHMGLGVHLVPTNAGWRNEPLLREMLGLGVTVHEANDFGAVEAGDPVLGFCNAEFLAALPRIRERTRRTVFANCMTGIFGKEREAMARGHIAMFLYQNPEVLESVAGFGSWRASPGMFGSGL